MYQSIRLISIHPLDVICVTDSVGSGREFTGYNFVDGDWISTVRSIEKIIAYPNSQVYEVGNDHIVEIKTAIRNGCAFYKLVFSEDNQRPSGQGD